MLKAAKEADFAEAGIELEVPAPNFATVVGVAVDPAEPASLIQVALSVVEGDQVVFD